MVTARAFSVLLLLLLIAAADIPFVADADAGNDADASHLCCSSLTRMPFLGNLSSIIMYCGNLPDYRQAWYTQIQ
jgi:hypothetical protein